MGLKFPLTAVALLSSCLVAHADQYELLQLAKSSGSIGNVSLGSTTATLVLGQGCVQFTPCWETVSFWPLGSFTTTFSSTGPGGLPSDPTFSAAQPINPNGGYVLISTGQGDFSTLGVENLATGDITTFYQGDWMNDLINGYGDVLFLSEPFDINFVAVNVTSHDAAATPEPSSLALFGTGIFVVVGVLRKRIA